MSKITKVEITSLIDVTSPTSQIIICLVIANSLVDLMYATSILTLHKITYNLVFLLFTLYVLNCYKSGGCSTLALVSSVALIILETTYLLVRLTVGTEPPSYLYF